MTSPDGKALETAFALLRVGILSLNREGHVQLQNAEASRILGVSDHLSYQREIADVLGSRHPVAMLAQQVLESRRDVTSNACTIPQREGQDPLVVDLSATPIAEDDEGIVLTLHDRTIGRELEALVDQHQRAELYGELAAGIAHEIRNPLGGIRGSAELLEGKLRDDKLRRYPRLIREETDRIRRLLDEFSELTRGGDLRLQQANIHEVLDRMLALQQESPNWRRIDVRREYDPSIPEFTLDPDRITQVFLNLCRNAVQAMSGQGRLTARTRVETIYQLAPGESGGPHHFVRVEIEDSGPGISETDLPHVFTPFFTRRPAQAKETGGSGLGLPIAQQWVVRHNGRIQIKRAHAGGTQVRVLLPLKTEL